MIARTPKGSSEGATEIRAEAVSRSFGAHAVLRGIDLEVLRGQIVAIVGASGSGKTVFLDILTALMRPDRGRVMVADHSRPGSPLVDLLALSPEELDRLRMHWSIVFQRNALFTGSVYDNIALWLREHTEMPEDQIRQRVRESLKAAALDVDDVIRKDREELSGGMAKRVAIARAIAVRPKVIFYDEPTTGLDPIISGQIHELIFNNHHESGDGEARTTLVITHDKELLRRVRPRVVMLHQGRIAFDGTYEEFTESRSPVAEEYLRSMPVLQARDESLPAWGGRARTRVK
ncbi:MAG: ATP-binding cassette domain-containing protein [Phycisphaerales bacterium]